MFPILILAGGKGTRLFPITHEVPKSMVEILGKPFLGWQLELLASAGFDRAILCLGEKATSIVDYVGDGSKFKLDVQYSFDGPNALGTAGAIANALPLLRDNFAVIYGDSYLPIDFHKIQEYYLSQDAIALMTIYKNENRFDQSNVHFKENKILEYSKNETSKKMKYIDYGFSNFN